MRTSLSRRWKLWGLLVALPILAVCAGWASVQLQRNTDYSVRVIAEYPHDPQAFTQGLIYYQGHLLEGTGHYGKSRLRRVEIKTGRVLTEVTLPRKYFGEGIAIANGELFQLTWKNRIGFVYDPDTLEYQRSVRFAGEGWGLTFDGEHLVISDGSATLRFVDPQTFQVRRRITVREGRKLINHLNELEFVEGEIWANIWYEERIARIDPQDGRLLGWINLKGLKPASLRWDKEAVHNGIAYDPDTGRLFLTGKNWPVLYEVEVIPTR
jgi:glutaminyl-peptide cyclotransferase